MTTKLNKLYYYYYILRFQALAAVQQIPDSRVDVSSEVAR